MIWRMNALDIKVMIVMTVEMIVIVVVEVTRVVVTAVMSLQKQINKSLAAEVTVFLMMQIAVASAGRLIAKLMIKIQDVSCWTSRTAAERAVMTSLFIEKLIMMKVVVIVMMLMMIKIQRVTIIDMKEKQTAV